MDLSPGEQIFVSLRDATCQSPAEEWNALEGSDRMQRYLLIVSTSFLLLLVRPLLLVYPMP